MKGHVRKRGSSWSYVVELGPQPAVRCEKCDKRTWVEDGDTPESCPKCEGPVRSTEERRQRWVSGFRTKREAETDMRETLSRLDGGRDPFPADISLRKLAEQWLEHKVSGSGKRIRPKTAKRYGQLLHRHILPAIGSVEVGKLRPAHCRRALDDMASKGLAPRTIAQARAVLRGVLGWAVREGLVEVNVAAATEPPQIEDVERPSLPADDLARIIDEAVGTTWEIPVLLACTVGTRRSETLGLRWSSVDLEAGEVWITEGLQRIDDELTFTPVKSHRSRRPVPLPRYTVDRLREHRKAQMERRVKAGPAWQDMNLVCERGDGGPMDPDAFTHAFKRILLRLGLPEDARLHDARHAVGDMLAKHTGGDAVVIRDTLGHARSAFTLDTYVQGRHSSEKARTALDEAFEGRG